MSKQCKKPQVLYGILENTNSFFPTKIIIHKIQMSKRNSIKYIEKPLKYRPADPKINMVEKYPQWQC